ncbi:MAG TPA: sterol desaturase family protein [Nannocystaceae bacterium]|nr:sterol desaturase family protein [Nannocystaceae bacterium]
MIEAAIHTLLGVLATPLQPASSVWWGHLLGAALVAALVHGRARGLLRALAPASIWRSRSTLHDLGCLVLNAILYSWCLLVPLQTLSTAVALGTRAALVAALGDCAALDGPLGGALAMLAFFVAADLAFFLSHWAHHRVPLLWELHRVHHSAQVLQPFTVFRRHPLEIAIDGALSGVLVGATWGVLAWAGAPPPWTILGVNAMLFVALFAGFALQHSHVWVSWGALDRVLVSPATHQLHHSRAKEHHDRNYGNVLAIWDLLAGTLARPARCAPPLQLGVDDGDDMGALTALYLRPLVRAWARLVRR